MSHIGCLQAKAFNTVCVMYGWELEELLDNNNYWKEARSLHHALDLVSPQKGPKDEGLSDDEMRPLK